MTKNQLAKELAVSGKLCLSTAVKAIDGLISIVSQAMVAGEEITIRGFGTLGTVDLKARKARNIRTGEEIDLPAQRTVKFRPSRELKARLNPDLYPAKNE